MRARPWYVVKGKRATVMGKERTLVVVEGVVDGEVVVEGVVDGEGVVVEGGGGEMASG